MQHCDTDIKNLIRADERIHALLALPFARFMHINCHLSPQETATPPPHKGSQLTFHVRMLYEHNHHTPVHQMQNIEIPCQRAGFYYFNLGNSLGIATLSHSSTSHVRMFR